jgi:outer membrane lipoprotein SlyB
MRKYIVVATMSACALVTACAGSVRPTEFAGYETGQVSRVEAATVVSISPAYLKSGLPLRALGRLSKESRKRGVNIVVRVERNNEYVSVTQGDDGGISVGTNVWIQYGERVRVIPK